MAKSAESCTHCDKQGAEFKRCSRCKQACYCGVACQNADWKRHKKKCAPPVQLQDIAAKINAAQASGDWRGVLKWEGRMEELMARQSDDACSEILSVFTTAHRMGCHATVGGSNDHARSIVGLVERRIPLLGKLQRFRDQGEAMCSLSDMLNFLERNSEAATWYQRARDVGAAHGFFSLESKACQGLGGVAINAGRHEEGVELLRNALVAAELNELDDPQYELMALEGLVEALFKTKSIDEVEPLVLRYREAAKAVSEKEGVCFWEFESLLCSARLYAVLCLCTPRLGTPYHSSVIASSTAIYLTVTGCTAPERRHMHLFNLALSAGTREASRGREGGARSARPDARERGKCAEVACRVCISAGASETAPHHSRSGGWGGGAYPGGGSRTGQPAHAVGTDGPVGATQQTAIGSWGWRVGGGFERLGGVARFAKLMTCISEPMSLQPCSVGG